MNYEGMIAETTTVRGENGDLIDAYLARPSGPGPFGSVVVIHHMPGWDRWIKSMTRDLASNGLVTIAPNLHFRETGTTPQERSESVRNSGGMPDARTMADVAGAIAAVKDLPYTNGKVGIIGFCSGGRQVYLAACTLSGINAAVDCWGGGVITPADQLTPQQPVSPIDYTADMSCPILGLFGNEDARPSPQEVNETEEMLKKHGKDYEFHRYDNAGHGFFAVDRDSYRQQASVDAWPKVIDFYNKHLSN
ncbi:MAG TPA: carboxymethylenebutenolidase [Dehalococcoidia bacterium]|jgi:carboxymethylenebutenolidase|nr:carboxymethylenebutenolidase [Dehalococcoidia bacterium]|tara:strand:- start:3250 stop:3996 length:747 start_codon:yes stop_codon:yes gene_type:complete